MFERLKIACRFRVRQDSSVSGLSENARMRRKKKNIVSMKFNMINYALETIVNILILFDNSRLSTILYILFMSGGTPLVYFMGIEENRKMAKEYFKSHIKIFKKKNRVQSITSSLTIELSIRNVIKALISR